MKKTTKKRAPHGATSLMVLDALVRLHTHAGRRVEVRRVDLLLAVRLPETTVDDRLRTLVKEGRVLRVGRALYVPKSWPGQEPVHSKPTYKKKITYLPAGLMVEEIWSSVSNTLLSSTMTVLSRSR